MNRNEMMFGIFCGYVLGLITAIITVIIIINSIGDSFKIENVNFTLALNQTQLENVIKESPRYQSVNVEPSEREWISPKADTDFLLSKEYDKGFIAGIESIHSNILFSGSTFEYGNYTIKAQDIQPGKAYIEVIQDGNYIFNGTCYKNQWCNIKDVSFQIDDIHIGKEAAYLVYWSDKP